jgi:hypothetical protein
MKWRGLELRRPAWLTGSELGTWWLLVYLLVVAVMALNAVARILYLRLSGARLAYELVALVAEAFVLLLLFSALVFVADRLNQKAGKRINRWGRPLFSNEGGLATFLVLFAIIFLLLGAFGTSQHIAPGPWLIGLGTVTLGGSVLKVYEELSKVEENRKALRVDLYQAYFLGENVEAIDSWKRAELAARIVSSAIASPLNAFDGLPDRLGEQVLNGSPDRRLIRCCIDLLAGDQDDHWAHVHAWTHRLEFGEAPARTRKAIATAHNFMSIQLPPEWENKPG